MNEPNEERDAGGDDAVVALLEDIYSQLVCISSQLDALAASPPATNPQAVERATTFAKTCLKPGPPDD